MIRLTLIAFSMIASRDGSFGLLSSACSCCGPGGGSSGWLLLEKMIASVSVRALKRAAKTCAIIPPIDAPTMWRVSIPRWSSSAAASSAMSSRL